MNPQLCSIHPQFCFVLCIASIEFNWNKQGAAAKKSSSSLALVSISALRLSSMTMSAWRNRFDNLGKCFCCKTAIRMGGNKWTHGFWGYVPCFGKPARIYLLTNWKFVCYISIWGQRISTCINAVTWTGIPRMGKCWWSYAMFGNPGMDILRWFKVVPFNLWHIAQPSRTFWKLNNTDVFETNHLQKPGKRSHELPRCLHI